MRRIENPYSVQDQNKQEEEFNKIRGILERSFNKMNIPSADIPDLAQEVAIKLMTTNAGFKAENGSSFDTWLYRIAQNTAYDYWRKKKALAYPDRNDEKNVGADALNEMEDSNKSFDKNFADQDYIQKLIAKTVASIKDSTSRAVFRDGLKLLLLQEMEGFNIKQISDQTGLNENTIKVKLFRTKQRLLKTAESLKRR